MLGTEVEARLERKRKREEAMLQKGKKGRGV
jgi:hypothetical protein